MPRKRRHRKGIIRGKTPYLITALDRLYEDYLERGMPLTYEPTNLNLNKDYLADVIAQNGLTKVSGLTNVSMDIRSVVTPLMETFYRKAKSIAQRIAQGKGAKVSFPPISNIPGLYTDEHMNEMFESVCEDLGYSSIRMSCGAGHDILSLGSVDRGPLGKLPSGFLFIPSSGGSHNPKEYASPEAMAKGATLAAHALYELAK